ncbi:DUF4349 domain-containing protein [Methanocella sp. CWC-04]|uniref:DUF4349 domain-containing protein n=1 Tax=Methanooceanicella nereidis TaxID=2052831 RepID=A0AAP2RBU8_9EURY|nr:DUF4349 domain-containing protein [Methanocella sp. CWC-04]MCD1294473.1 DUF4349 domain-containing protein [Methanocella sp. CWC-04]
MRHRNIPGTFAILIIIVTILFSGCMGQESYTDKSPGISYDGGSSAPYPAPDTSKGSETLTGSTSQTSTDYGNAYTNISDRKVIMTATVHIETDKYDNAVNRVREITSGYGGYIESSSTYLSDNGKHTTTITMKVPQSAFEPALAQVKTLGKVQYEQSSGQDVTKQFIDLNARLKNLKLEEEKLNEIMNRAMTVDDVLQVSKELSRVRYEIERTTAELNYLSARIDFSTITVKIMEPEPVVSYDWGIDDAFREAARAFVSMLGALVVLTGYLIPIILYIAIGLAILYLLLKISWQVYKKFIKKK